MLSWSKVVFITIQHSAMKEFFSQGVLCDSYDTSPALAAMADYGVESSFPPWL